MRIVIDPGADEPPYAQIRDAVAGQARDGMLPAGTRLPAVRALAGELGLAVNTVARAYRELEQAGLVETRGRHGTVVTARAAGASAEATRLAGQYATATRAHGVPPEQALDLARAALGL
ncbi:GntR family transcriptional regulator [Catenuloplanes atrovinosus]|uniref:DNA-binding transcriptional regulator YhcF (GntR family) n=1 Tax=Catenuloplanes atrovinosus TaxID=137266 RepID=A0AAE4C8V4_9ACTN|nr:GntR family transcriptional regulator [Catenuloplanes atrovinosus]MDR7275921.1 DNA-binding transcriptional regulator YhcF (GntR family) [Catenuloplanes atrovinosus]